MRRKTAPAPPTATVYSAFEYYLTEVPVSDKSKANIRTVKEKVLQAGILFEHLDKVTSAMVLKFLNGLTGLSPGTVFMTYIQLKSVLNRYIKDHNLDIHLRLDRIIKAPRPKQTVEGAEEYLTLQEVRDLMAVDLKDKPEIEYARDLFCLMCFTGMAVGDLCRFSKDWISKDEKWLTYYRKKSGGKCEIPMLPVTYTLINRYKWPCRVSIRTMQYHCATMSILVGRKVTPHGARKTWGSVALELGFSIQSVAAMLGHTSSRITERIYAKVTKQKLEREMNEMPESLRELMKID